MMAAYDLDELIRRWTLEKLTTEQAVGQVLQQLQALSGRVCELERRLEAERQGKGISLPLDKN